MHKSDIRNILVLVLVALPPLSVAFILKQSCSQLQNAHGLCWLYLQKPIWAANLLWTFHVDITFYLISLAQV